MQSLDDLLLNVSCIHKRYLSNRNTKLSGRSFNVFSVLRVEYKEIRHSAFLAELLNPKGSHQMGDAFLKLFYKRLGINNVKDFSKIVVSREFVTETGNIDIYVQAEEPENSLIIENKIYADDQDGQLARYHKFDSSARLIYLTLDGHFASEKSLVYKNGSKSYKLTSNDYERISYTDFIITWLEQCRALVTDNPSVKEILDQYIDLLQKMTKHILNQDEKMEIAKEVVKSKESVQAFLSMLQSSSEIYKQISFLIWDEIQKVAGKWNATPQIFPTDSTLNNKCAYVVFDFGFECCPAIGFEKENFNGIWYGITGKDGTNKNISEDKIKIIRKKFEDSFEKPLNPANPVVHQWWGNHCNLNAEQFSSIYDGSFANDLEALFQKLKSLIETVC